MTNTTTQALGQHRGAGKGKIFAWALWDWGTQPFATVITTFVFAVYITSSSFGSENYTNIAMSISTGIAGLLIALLAPVLGQNSDRNGRRMASLRNATWALAIVCGALYFVKPEPSYLVLGLALMGIGAIIAEIANVNYYALLDELATPENVGKVSGFGWGMGYLGGIVSLLALNFLFIAPNPGLFGVTHDDGMHIRVSMLVCALWTIIFTIPIFLNLRDRKVVNKAPRTNLKQAYKELWASIKRLWNSDRNTAYFLIASAIFRDGLAGVFTFGAVIAAGTFKMSAAEVIMFGAAANVIAGLATIAFGYLDDWIGPKRVIMISLVSMVFAGLAVFVVGRGVALDQISEGTGKAIFWGLGLALTIFVGPAQSASRSFLARIIPEGKSGEMFGLYVTTGRAVSFFSPAAYGIAIWLGALFTGRTATQYWGILGIVLILIVGAILMRKVQAPPKRTKAAVQ